VRLARQPDPTGRDEFRRKAESQWQAAFAGRTNRRPSLRKKSAAIDLCRADIIDWLAHERSTGRSTAPGGVNLLQPAGLSSEALTNEELWRPDPDSINGDRPAVELRPAASGAVVDRLGAAADNLFQGAIDDIAAERFRGEIPDSVKMALADHFWCDLLAQLAHVLDEGLKLLESVPDRVVDLVMKSRKEARWRDVEERVLRIAARSVWRKIRLLAFFGVLSRKVALPLVRMLAVLSCKAPERHRAVVEYCVDPLGKQLLAETKDRLKTALSDWLPQLTAAGTRRLPGAVG
jgi:hypothetical protein